MRALEIIEGMLETDGYSTSIVDVPKTNGIKVGIQINNGGVNPIFYEEDIKQMLEGGATYEDIKGVMVDACNTMLKTEEFTSPEWILNHANLMLVKTNWNDNSPYLLKPFGNTDLSTLIYISIDNERIFKVTDTVINISGLSYEQIYNAAYDNLLKREFKVTSLGGGFYVIIDESNGRNGATCILRDDVLEQAKEKIGGDFYIIPSSVHEVLVIPEAFMEPDAAAAMIQSVNGMVVGENERLSDRPYIYKNGEVRMVELEGERCLDINSLLNFI